MNIIGPKFLEKVRSSDYKNSTYAIAEIIDNSVDAEATEVEIITVSRNNKISDVYFVDNGKGMSKDKLETCVVFATSHHGPGSKKTGVFGMGLPNASLSQCRRFAAITEIGGQWYKNEVDIKKMLEDNTLEIQPILKLENSEIERILKKSKIEKPKTIIHWTDIDQIQIKPNTLKDRSKRLIGRIHRHKIREGLTIRFLNFNDGNPEPLINEVFFENDPMYLTKGPTYIAPTIIELSTNVTSPNPFFSQDTYFKKFVLPGNPSNTVAPLFYELEHARSPIEIEWNGKKYKIELVLSVAYRDIQKPGCRNGGSTKFGKELGIKVKGSGSYPSGNISWIRNGREITCGNYSLFNVTQENQRFWSIELVYSTEETEDNVLDTLLGLTYNKQSIKYEPDEEMPDNTSSIATKSEKSQELTAKITSALNKAIKKANERLNAQAREWKREEDTQTGGNGGGDEIPGATDNTYKILLEALGRGANLSSEEQEVLVRKLKDYLPTIEISQIKTAVKKYSEIGLQNIIIYCELDARDLFQTSTFQGKNITLINVVHPFYSKIIEPLREKNEMDLLASLELLISSMSRVGENNFNQQVGAINRSEIIREFFDLTSRDIKNLLNIQADYVQQIDSQETEEDEATV